MSNKLYRDDIRKLAREIGIKYTKNYSTEKLCEFLNIEYTPGPRNMKKPFYVKNIETDEETVYKSRYKAMKELGVRQEINWHAGHQKPLTIKGVKYMVRQG